MQSYKPSCIYYQQNKGLYMLILLLLISLSLLSTLTHCMKRGQNLQNTPKNLSIIPNFDQANIEKFGDIINQAAHSHKGYLTTTLIKMCLPSEVVEKYINPHLARFIIQKYQHDIIDTKKSFNKERSLYNKTERDIFSHHDGTYFMAPQTSYNYNTWTSHQKNQLPWVFPPNEFYLPELISYNRSCNKHITHALAKKLDDTDKEFFVCIAHKLPATLTFDNPPSHYLFSNDASFFIVGFPKIQNNNNVEIYKTSTLKKESFLIDGNVSALCSAYHSPIFAIGSDNQSPSKENHNLLYLSSKKTIWLTGIHDPIYHVTFNDDDTKLLTCSHNETNNKSHIIIWDTTDCNKIAPTYDTHCTGPIQKVFFTNNNRIVIVNADGSITIIKITPPHWHFTHFHDFNNPLITTSNKNSLLIAAYDNTIAIKESYRGNLLNTIYCHNTPITSLGLTTDENKIILEDEEGYITIITLYNEDNIKNIDFIEKANIIQLYTLLLIGKHYEHNHEKLKFTKEIKGYIKKQQKIQKDS